MRNRNIFIRKESAFSSVYGNGLPIFANVVGYHDGNVHYAVDWPEPIGPRGQWRWHYGDQSYHWNDELQQRSGTYVKPLEDFLSRFSPDYDNTYGEFL